MSRIKVLLLVGFAALMLSAVAVSSASAEWLVNGTVLKAGEAPEIASLPLIDSKPILHIAGVNISIECETLHIFGGQIRNPNIVFIKEILFLGCRTIAPTNTHCQLRAGVASIPTTALLGIATLTRITNGKAESGKLFANIPFEEEQSLCAVQGEQPVKGEGILGAPTNNTDKVEQLVTGLGSLENNSLEVGVGNKGFLLGAILVGLASGSKWAFH